MVNSQVVVIIIPTGDTAEHNRVSAIDVRDDGALMLYRGEEPLAFYPCGTWIIRHIKQGDNLLRVDIR